MKIIKIKTPFITLGQFLKFTGTIQNGGEAKMYLAENIININGEIDCRRGRKIYPGDTVQVQPNSIFKIERSYEN